MCLKSAGCFIYFSLLSSPLSTLVKIACYESSYLFSFFLMKSARFTKIFHFFHRIFSVLVTLLWIENKYTIHAMCVLHTKENGKSTYVTSLWLLDAIWIKDWRKNYMCIIRKRIFITFAFPDRLTSSFYFLSINKYKKKEKRNVYHVSLDRSSIARVYVYFVVSSLIELIVKVNVKYRL